MICLHWLIVLFAELTITNSQSAYKHKNEKERRKMKKFLSIILAAVMLISLVPSAFAVEDAVTGLNTLTYKFNYSELGRDNKTLFTDTSLKNAATDANATGDAWQILRWTTNHSGVSATSSYVEASFMRFIAKNSIGAILIAINVDKAGVYKPSITYNKSTRGARLQTYILKDIDNLSTASTTVYDDALYGDVTEKYSANILQPSETTENYIDTLEKTLATERDTNESTGTFDTEITFTETGTYYVAFVACGASEGLSKSPGIIYPVRLTLQEIEVESEPEK